MMDTGIVASDVGDLYLIIFLRRQVHRMWAENLPTSGTKGYSFEALAML